MDGKLVSSVIIDPDVVKVAKRVAATFQAADLDEALEMVNRRVLGDDPKKQVTKTEMPDGSVVLHLKPFAELALRAAVDIAVSEMDAATKTRKIGETLSFAGF